jgi:hypothetical protein
VTLGQVNYEINMIYYMKTEITGVGTRAVGTSELSNLKTGTLETGITGGFPASTWIQMFVSFKKKS